MNFRKRLEHPPVGLQLAPMIDVILFLLCFFLLTWNLARYEADLNIKIPRAAHAEDPKQLPGEVIINISVDGAVNLNRRVVSNAELEAILRGVVEQHPDQAVIIRADQGTPYRHVVAVLDLCRSANLWNIAFATLRSES